MDNILLTKVSKYGLNLAAEEIKTSVNSFIVIGSTNPKDQNLISRLESNDINNDLTYQEIITNKWNGFEDRVFTSYFDKNNFLTFELKLPYEETFSIYIYAFALLNVSNGRREIISITRSPSIFNKVKNSSSTFYIKFTFSQEDKNIIYNNDLFSSQFVSRELLFIANLDSTKNVIQSNLELSNINVGTKLFSKNLNENTVVIGNSLTDSTLQINELKISQNPKNTINNDTIFIEKILFNQNDYVTKPEFDKAINDHNHNKEYYRIGEAVDDSFMLNGKSSEYYANYSDIEWVKKELNKKVDIFGGTIQGYLKIIRPNDVPYMNDEIPPIYYVKSLIKDLKDYTDGDFKNNLQQQIDTNKNSIQLLSNKEAQDIESLTNKINKNKDDQNIVNSNINRELDNKMNKTDSVFNSTPSIQETQSLSSLTDNSILNYGGVKKAIERVSRTIDLDLSSLENTKCYPVIFNEGNPDGFTDSIIWNVKSDYVKCMSKIHIYGNGADNGNNSAFLIVNHSKTGTEAVIKRIYSPSTSTAIIVYLRGGFKYKCNLRGTDNDPKIVLDSYTLQRSTYIASSENWDNSQVIPRGSWWFMEFRSLVEINLDYTTKPDIPISNSTGVRTFSANLDDSNQEYDNKNDTSYLKLDLNRAPTINDIPNGKIALVVRS